MTGLIRKATLMTLCGCVVAGAAMAGIPSASTSTVPTCIKLVGRNLAGAVDTFEGDEHGIRRIRPQ